MCRKLALAATALAALIVAGPAFAWGKKHDAPPATPAPAAAAAPGTAATGPAANGQAAPTPDAPPRKATPVERAQADRLDPLARAAFWAREYSVDATDTDAGVRLAASLRAVGQFNEAAQTAQQVLVVDPNNYDALLETARAFVASGQGFYAIDPAKRAQKINGRDWRPVSLLGVALGKVGREEEAQVAYQQALALSPENPAVLSNMAMTLAAKGQGAQAEALLRRAAARPDASVQVRQNLTLVLGLEGKFDEAEKLLREDLPPEAADNNLAYLKSLAGGETTSRSWDALRGAQAGGGG